MNNPVLKWHAALTFVIVALVALIGYCVVVQGHSKPENVCTAAGQTAKSPCKSPAVTKY